MLCQGLFPKKALFFKGFKGHLSFKKDIFYAAKDVLVKGLFYKGFKKIKLTSIEK